jgi:acetyl-CoA acetyltransferase
MPFVLEGVRTPVGRYGGSLAHIRTDDLLGQTMVRACERVGVDLDRIEDIAAGCVNVAHVCGRVRADVRQRPPRRCGIAEPATAIS